MFTLREDQLADVDRVLAEPSRAAVIGTDVGGGKTATAVQIAISAGCERILLIVPPNTIRGWKRHINLLDRRGLPVRVISNKTQETTANFIPFRDGEPGWNIIGWEFARQFDLQDVPLDFVLGDEAHRAQNRKSDSYGMFSDVCHAVQERGGWTIAMSATWMGNKPHGAFGVANSLWPTEFHHFWPFVEKYLGKVFNAMAGPKGAWEPGGREKVPGSIVRDLPLYVRHERGRKCCEFHPRGLQADLPPRVKHPVDVELSATQRKLYSALVKDNFAWLDNCDNPLTTQGFPIVLNTRLRQICLGQPSTELKQRLNAEGEVEDYVAVHYEPEAKSTKIDATLEILSDIPEGERVVIFSHSAGIATPLVHRINKRFGAGPARAWNGSVSAAERNRIFEGFVYGATVPFRNPVAGELETDEDVRVIVAQIGAIGEGVDGLQWVCANEIWFSMESNNLLNIQAAGRNVRDGQLRTVNAWSLEAEDTVEQNQLEALDRQTVIMADALHSPDGD